MRNTEDSAILLVLVLVLEIPRKTEDEKENEDEERTIHIIKMFWATRPHVRGYGILRAFISS
jgi:hypothetical protein